MATTIYLDEPLGDREDELACEEARIMGDVVRAVPEEDGQETVVPLANVTGIRGDVVDQQIEEIASPGGRFTELVTTIS